MRRAASKLVKAMRWGLQRRRKSVTAPSFWGMAHIVLRSCVLQSTALCVFVIPTSCSCWPDADRTCISPGHCGQGGESVCSYLKPAPARIPSSVTTVAAYATGIVCDASQPRPQPPGRPATVLLTTEQVRTRDREAQDIRDLAADGVGPKDYTTQTSAVCILARSALLLLCPSLAVALHRARSFFLSFVAIVSSHAPPCPQESC